MATHSQITDKLGSSLERGLQDAANRTGRSFTLTGSAVDGEKRFAPGQTVTLTREGSAHARTAFLDADEAPDTDTPEDLYRERSIDPPSESEFDGAEVDYLPAPEIEAIADRLRAEKPHFEEIRGFSVAFWWKRKGGQSGGKCVLGKCARTPALARALKPSTWTIWLAADHCREFGLTDRQFEALVFHELRHCTLAETEVKDKITGEVETEYRPAVVGHDLEMFFDELTEYGLWTSELRRAKTAFEQVEMPGFGECTPFGGRA
jgi:hypothetical protein